MAARPGGVELSGQAACQQHMHDTVLPLQIGGMRLAFDPRVPDPFNRLVDVTLNIAGSPSVRSYSGDLMLLTTNYVASGGDK